MKYLNSIYKLLLEFVTGYKWGMIDDDPEIVKYEFDDDFGNRYLVEFKNIKSGKTIGTEYELVYFVWDEKIKNYSVSKLTKTNPYRTTETIFGDILKNFLKRNSWVKKVRIEGLSKDFEKEYISQRTKMYVRYLERNPIDGYQMKNFGNKIYLIKE